MTARQSRLLGAALLVAAVSTVLLLGRREPTDALSTRATTANGPTNEQLEQTKARLERGPYILRSKQVSEAETIQIIIIPEGLSEELDTRCVVYKNDELRTSSITCAGVLFRPSAPAAS